MANQVGCCHSQTDCTFPAASGPFQRLCNLRAFWALLQIVSWQLLFWMHVLCRAVCQRANHWRGAVVGPSAALAFARLWAFYSQWALLQVVGWQLHFLLPGVSQGTQCQSLSTWRLATAYLNACISEASFASRKREAGRGVFYLLFLLAYAFRVPITFLT
jgi:hypothetical protein